MRVKQCVPTGAAPLTGITTPQTKATRRMIATAAVTWTAAFLNPAMRPATVWSWPWRSQKSVTASTRTLAHSSRPFGPTGKFYNNKIVISLC